MDHQLQVDQVELSGHQGSELRTTVPTGLGTHEASVWEIQIASNPAEGHIRQKYAAFEQQPHAVEYHFVSPSFPHGPHGEMVRHTARSIQPGRERACFSPWLNHSQGLTLAQGLLPG
jgi:hypothetical protein